MELKQIEYFLQLAQMQHVSQTAHFLNISQSTLSKSLAGLERDLGVPLFDRVGNRIRLNSSGRHFYEHAKQAIQSLNTASLSAKQFIYEVSGNISIVCLTFAPILIPCISEYTRLNPLVNIQVSQYNHNLNRNSDTDYDFILTSVQGEVSHVQSTQLWVTQPLFSENGLFVIGPKHPQFAGLPDHLEEIDLTQFVDANFVTMRVDNNFSDFSYDICEHAGFTPKSYFQTNDFLIKMNMIREGHAVSFLPESCIAEAELLCPGMRYFQVKHNDIRRTVLMMRKKKRFLGEAALDFWDFVLEHYNLPSDTRE